MRALLLSIAFASVVRRAEQTAAESEVAVASDGAEAGPPSRRYVTRADGTRVPFCTYSKPQQCETACGAVSLDGIDIRNMELGPKRCARCEWVRSKKSSVRRTSVDVADPDSITCGVHSQMPGAVNGFSVETITSWGVTEEKCCYADICFPDQEPGTCIDEDDYRYGAYFGEEGPASTTNHGPDGYLPPTFHRAGGHVGVNNAWRHVDTQAGVDAVRDARSRREEHLREPLFPMDPPTPSGMRDLTPVNPRGCDFEKGLLDSCLQMKPASECKGYLELLRNCLA